MCNKYVYFKNIKFRDQRDTNFNVKGLNLLFNLESLGPNAYFTFG